MAAFDTSIRTASGFPAPSAGSVDFDRLGPIAQSNNPTAAGNTDLGKGEIQGVGPDGKVYKTNLIMRIYDGSGALRYYANGRALPPNITSEAAARIYVRQQIGKGSLGTLQLGNQQAFPTQTAGRKPANATNPALGTIPVTPNRDVAIGAVQAQGPDGKVYQGELRQRLYGTGQVSYFFKGTGDVHKLPTNITSSKEAAEYVRTQINQGNFNDLKLGDQKAVGITPSTARSSAPQSWQISGKSPDGRTYSGQLIQANWNTGTSGSKFVFKGDGNSHELPSSVTTLAQANTYVRQKISSGTWKDKNPDPKIYTVPDGKGKIREFNSGQITMTELKEKRVFSDGKWTSGGFVADGVKRYSSNPLQGGSYNAEAQGYFIDGNKQQKQITKPDGTVIKDLDAAKARVKELVGQGVFMPSKSVAQMSPGEKLDYVLTVALKNATPAVAAELKALFTPENMAKMAILGGVQFIPGVGIAADIVVGICVGQQAIDVGIKYFNAIYTALNATTKAELDSSGVAIAQATAQLGVGVGSTLVGAGIAKGLRTKIAKNKTGGAPPAAEAPATAPSAAPVKPTKPTKTGRTPNLGATLKAAQTTTENLVTAGTLGGLAYLKAKYDRGEVAIGYADQLPGMKNAVTTIFNDASENNSVGGLQRQIVVYTTKPGSKEADGYFLANVNASVASSKIFNIGNITKDIKNGTFNLGGWMDWGKINLIAQNLAAKDQTGGGVRATVGSALSVNAGIYFGIPEVNTRLKASVNLMSINGTMRAMSIGPNGKKQDKASKVEVAKALVQGYFNLYSAIPSKDTAGKRTGQSPNIGGMQFQINKQFGLPGGFALNVSDVQPSKKEWNIFIDAKTTDGTDKRIVRESYPRGKAASTSAFNLLFNGNKNTNLSLGDVVSAPFRNDGKVTGELGKQFSGFSEAMRHAFLDPYPVGSPGYVRQQNDKIQQGTWNDR
jgi:hypothetical protein